MYNLYASAMLTKMCIVKVMIFPVVMYGCLEFNYKEGWVPKNYYFLKCCVEEDSWGSLGLQGDQTIQS